MSEDQKKVDLTFMSTDELLNEVFSRFDGAVFAGATTIDQVRERYFYRSYGGYVIACGLSQLILNEQSEQWDRTIEDEMKDREDAEEN